MQRETLCGPYAESFGEIASGFWQATAIFLAVGIFILCTVALVSVFTMCVQSIMKKSIFNVCGLLQGIAGRRGERAGSPRAVGVGRASHPRRGPPPAPQPCDPSPVFPCAALSPASTLWGLVTVTTTFLLLPVS